MFRGMLLRGLRRYKIGMDSELKASIAHALRIYASQIPSYSYTGDPEDIVLYINPAQLIASTFEWFRTDNDNWTQLTRIGYLMAAQLDEVPDLADPNQKIPAKSIAIHVASEILAEIFYHDQDIEEQILAYFNDDSFGVYQAFYSFMQKSGSAIRQLIPTGPTRVQGQNIGYFSQTQLRATYALGRIFITFERHAESSIKFMGDSDDISFFSYGINVNDISAAIAMSMIEEVSRLCPQDVESLKPLFPENESYGGVMVYS